MSSASVERVKYTIEIAVTDFITAQSAVKGGADRIELCTGLSEGGLTPSFGLIQQCREKLHTTLFPIIRSRSGDFLYTEDEYELMLQDIRICKQLQCDGVVIGFLTRDGQIDAARTARAVQEAYPMQVTFHRAFDRCRDPFEALDVIVQTGCARILTSGQQVKAVEALDVIQQLVAAAGNRISIMPGSGVSAFNIEDIKNKTGAREFHASLRTTAKSEMQYVNPAFIKENDFVNPAVHEEAVRSLRMALG
ncbi:copper homeostasis protein [Filimonas lacunae]|uniref:PF03932 family protein CutC n=1 Tax=Filimonas lacunae TaxID=477680 RepID=A0A173MMA9_9BACT|nr:copper homeostasis protein CutC [Filimonas lacunae]BAV08785.1 cytoplasmic copper homeostasis protein CutC [Filimonas lacunae]SIS61698.1 copper homeostasis protein [Filimonas lacunae]